MDWLDSSLRHVYRAVRGGLIGWPARLAMGMILSIAVAHASNTFSGIFSADDDQAAFLFSLNSPAVVTIVTSSYAAGGFAPVLSVFGPPAFGPGDPSLIGTNSGGQPCGVRSVNPTTGVCLDALLGFDSVLNSNQLGTLSAGSYLVILTQQANTPNGPDLASGFAFDGQPNFTAIPGVNDGPFVDPTNPNITDTGNWSVTFENVDSVDPLSAPEPSSLVLLAGGLAVMLRQARKNLRGVN